MSEDHHEVIAQLRKVLVKVSGPTMFGVSRQLLPFTISQIKEAIKRAIALESVKPRRDRRRIDRWKKDYVALARFVDYGAFGLDGELLARQEMSQFLKEASQETRNKALKISESIRNQESQLKEEIRQWCQEFKL